MRLMPMLVALLVLSNIDRVPAAPLRGELSKAAAVKEFESYALEQLEERKLTIDEAAKKQLREMITARVKKERGDVLSEDRVKEGKENLLDLIKALEARAEQKKSRTVDPAGLKDIIGKLCPLFPIC